MDMDKKCLCDENMPKSNCTTPQKTMPAQNVGWTWLLVLAGLSTTIGSSVPIGYIIGVVNAPAVIIQDWFNASMIARYEVAVDRHHMEMIWSAVVSIFLIGGMTGSFAGAWFADKLGRKGALMVGGFVGFLTSIMFVIAKPLNSVELIFLARFIAGLSSGMVMPVMPMYLTELAPVELRGAVGALCPLGLSFGVVFAQVTSLPQLLGTEDYWHFLLGFYGLLIVVGHLSFPWLPESPKYLYAIRGHRQQAIKELSRLRNLPDEYVCCELEEKVETTGEWTIWKVITSSELRLNLALVCAYHFGQQFSGINAVFYYSVSIFKTAGLSEHNAQLASIGSGAMNMLISLIMVPLVNIFPRRTLSIWSCSLATTMLVFLSFCITFMESFSWMPFLSIVAVLGYVLSYGLALGPIPFFIGAELFELGPRPAAMALGTTANWLGNLSVGLFFPTMQLYIKQYSFFVFAASTALLTIFIKTCLPETNVHVLAKRKESLTKVNI